MDRNLTATLLVILLFLTMLNTSVAVLEAMGVDVTASAVYGGVDLEVTAPPAEAAPPAAPSGGYVKKLIEGNVTQLVLKIMPTAFSVHGEYLKPDTYTIDTSDAALLAVEGIRFTLLGATGVFDLIFEEVDKPPQVPDAPPVLYQYYNATLIGIGYDQFRDIDLDIRVSKSWISDQQINAGTIAMYRYTTRWDKLATAKVSEDAKYIHYRARTPGLSYFAVSGERLPTLIPAIPVEIKYVSPLAWLVIVIALVNAAILYLLTRRKV